MRTSEQLTLLSLVRGQRWRYLGATLAQGLATLLLFGPPLVSMTAIDRLVPPAPLGNDAEDVRPAGPEWANELFRDVAEAPAPEDVVWRAGTWIVVLTVAACILLYLRARWSARASETIVRQVRDRLFGHYERLGMAWHDEQETGDLVQRASSDVDTLRLCLSTQVVEIGRALLLLLIVIPILWSIDPAMTVWALVLLPVILTFASLFLRKVKRLFLAMDESEGRLTTNLQENLSGIRVVRAFCRQEHEIERFAESNADLRDHNQRLVNGLATFWSVSDLMCFAQIGVVVVAGAQRIDAGTLTLGEFFAVFTYVWTVIWPVRHMGRVLADTGKAVVAAQRIHELLAAPDETAEDRVEAMPLNALSGALEISKLSFAYDDGEAALSDFSLSVRPGETVALIGPPGSGKSTLASLLLRLYDYRVGSIRVDGKELSSLPRGYVRSQFATVLQEPFLYAKTIAENLAVGRGGATRVRLERAARDAAVHDNIVAFTDGYDTLVGERGVTLSGGQKQRVAIARALLAKAPFLILDDALSAVDTGTEAHILRALRERRGRRTTILVAHRLSSVLHADRILVLEEGRIVQRGTHAELAQTEGPYRRLWRIQGALDEDIERATQRARHAALGQEVGGT